MTAVRAAAETIDFRRGCGSSDGSAFQRSSHRSPRPMEWLSILRNSSSRCSVAIVSTGSSSWRQSQAIASVARTAAPPGCFVPRAYSSSVKIVLRGDRRPRLRSSAAARITFLPQRWGRRASCALSLKTTNMDVCRCGQRPPPATIAPRKSTVVPDERTRVRGGRGAT